jgi:membrane-associated phospholipid phosphatase
MEEATRLEARGRFRWRYAAIGALAAALVLLAVLHVDGRFDRLDRYGLDRWMPGLDPEPETSEWPSVWGLFFPFSLDTSWWEKLLSVATYPASALVSFLVFAAGCVVLWRRGARVPALVWGCSWFVANAVEVGLKASLTRPPLYAVDSAGVEHHLRGFDHAFPSGHTLRAVMLAGLLAYLWRQLAWPVALWALTVPVLLVISAAHVPGDVIGGLVFGLLVVVTTTTLADSPRVEAWLVGRLPVLRHAA